MPLLWSRTVTQHSIARQKCQELGRREQDTFEEEDTFRCLARSWEQVFQIRSLHSQLIIKWSGCGNLMCQPDIHCWHLYSWMSQSEGLSTLPGRFKNLWYQTEFMISSFLFNSNPGPKVWNHTTTVLNESDFVIVKCKWSIFELILICSNLLVIRSSG